DQPHGERTASAKPGSNTLTGTFASLPGRRGTCAGCLRERRNFVAGWASDYFARSLFLPLEGSVSFRTSAAKSRITAFACPKASAPAVFPVASRIRTSAEGTSYAEPESNQRTTHLCSLACLMVVGTRFQALRAHGSLRGERVGSTNDGGGANQRRHQIA